MLTMSMVMNYYAIPRKIRDIDIVNELNSAEVNRIAIIFNEYFFISEERIRENDERKLKNVKTYPFI